MFDSIFIAPVIIWKRPIARYWNQIHKWFSFFFHCFPNYLVLDKTFIEFINDKLLFFLLFFFLFFFFFFFFIIHFKLVNIIMQTWLRGQLLRTSIRQWKVAGTPRALVLFFGCFVVWEVNAVRTGHVTLFGSYCLNWKSNICIFYHSIIILPISNISIIFISKLCLSRCGSNCLINCLLPCVTSKKICDYSIHNFSYYLSTHLTATGHVLHDRTFPFIKQ